MDIARVYPNVLILALLFAVASALLTIFTPEGLGKASFLMGTGLAPSYLTMALVFARRAAKGGRAPEVDPNVIFLVLLSLTTLGILVGFHDVTVFKDMVAEGVGSAITGAGISIMMAFATADHSDE